MNRWKIVSQKTVYKSKYFNVREQIVKYPSGKEKIHGIVERKPTVVVFPLTESYEIYLISEYRDLFKKNIIEAVAGHVDGNESPLKCAIRELKEEAGITATQWEELANTEGSASVIRSQVHLFLAREIELGKQSPEEGEEISIIRMPLHKAVEMVFSGEINNSSTMLGILILDKLKKEQKI